MKILSELGADAGGQEAVKAVCRFSRAFVRLRQLLSIGLKCSPRQNKVPYSDWAERLRDTIPYTRTPKGKRKEKEGKRKEKRTRNGDGQANSFPPWHCADHD